jgi:Capsule assembly protein Wzi/PAP2 superfamily
MPIRVKPAILILLLCHVGTALSQQIDDPKPASLAPSILLRNLADDQKTLWSSPFKARVQDLNWLVPIAGLTAGLVNADSELSSRISNTGSLARKSSTISNAGIVVALGGTGGLYLLGRWHQNEHQQETAVLSGEAALDSYLIDQVLKLATRREFPTDDSGQGKFWRRNTANTSFPSGHAIVTWSVASVLAHEYPGPLTKFLAYGLATGVSLTRVTGKKHFPSDVVVGSALGWMIGRQVYVKHHDTELGGAGFGTFHSAREMSEDRSSENIASIYVPLDSWIYAAFDRLAALGLVPSAMEGMKPWTRRECARLLEEASGEMDDLSPSEASRLYTALSKEFARELNGDETNYAALDSIYTRVTSISGQPLTDGYHFGQTIVNDYGRPYQRGTNYLGGFSSSASAGALGFYVRGEFEHSPSAPGFSQPVVNAIQFADGKPLVATASPIPAFNQFRLLDTYIMLNLKGWQASFGKQSLWLGPTQDPYLFSNNAEPIYMFRISQTAPRKLPGILGFLGPYRTELFIGKLTGQHFVNTEDGNIAVSLGRSLERQPMINGQKITFKPTPNLEFGVGKTGLWGGPGLPITLHSTERSLFAPGNGSGRNDPGDRRATFDFSYHIPGLRKWLVLYDDSFTEDEPSPIGYPQQSAHNAGFYMPQLPKLPKLDFRAEVAYTDLQDFLQPVGGGFFYWNLRYLDGYTSKGNIMGNATVGRQGIAYRGSSTYWFAPDKTLRLGYRSEEADSDFAGGGHLKDVYWQSEWSFNKGVSLSSFMQYEWWNWPVLGNKKNDFTASVQLTYWPHWRFKGGN